MKKMILWICLISLLVFSSLLLCGCTSIVSFDSYENVEKYETGDKIFDAEIKEVEINWSCGEIKIVKSSSTSVTVTESGGTTLSEEKRVHTYLDGDILKIQFWKSGLSSSVDSTKKHVTVEVPDGVDIKINNTSSTIVAESLNTDSVDIRSVSGGIRIGDISSCNLMVVSTSGGIRVESISSDDAKIISTSGSIRIENADIANVFDCGSVSGSVNVGSVKAPQVDISSTSGSINIGAEACDKIDIGTTSGSIDITLAEGMGASVEFSSTSGSIKIEKQFCNSGNKYIIENGGCDISVSSTSGSLKIR